MENDQPSTSPGQDIQGQSGDKAAPGLPCPAPAPTEQPSAWPEAAVCDISEELSRQLEDIIKTYGSATSLMEKESTATGTDRPEKGEPGSLEDAEYEDGNEESEKEKPAPEDASKVKEPSGNKEQKLEKKILKGLGKYLHSHTPVLQTQVRTSGPGFLPLYVSGVDDRDLQLLLKITVTITFYTVTINFSITDNYFWHYST